MQSKEVAEDGCLLGCCAVKSGKSLPTFQRYLLLHHQGDGDGKHCRNVNKRLPDYTALQPRRQPAFFLFAGVRTSNLKRSSSFYSLPRYSLKRVWKPNIMNMSLPYGDGRYHYTQASIYVKVNLHCAHWM
jgi:hypothetical protein